MNKEDFKIITFCLIMTLIFVSIIIGLASFADSTTRESINERYCQESKESLKQGSVRINLSEKDELKHLKRIKEKSIFDIAYYCTKGEK